MYFGTDGIRGIANVQLTAALAQSCGTALTVLKPACRVIVARDTRASGSMLLHALAAGIMQGGGDVVDAGILPTAGVAYLTESLGADYGVVVSASHNPEIYNGIKIFDCRGFKLGDEGEERCERAMASGVLCAPQAVGGYTFLHDAAERYVNHVCAHGERLEGLKLLLDCANGAAFNVAPRIFRRLGADVTAVNTLSDGAGINDRAGALWARLLKERVVEGGFDAAFAFDGDADRLIAVDETGREADGDKLLFALACERAERGALEPPLVVGTSNTNLGIERELARRGIGFVRADVGDKYVLARMKACGAALGGEQSGHIISLDNATTGDGILSAVLTASLLVRTGRRLSEATAAECLAQINESVCVADKFRVINNESLSNLIEEIKVKLGGDGRALVRASGTENKIRIMVESREEKLAKRFAEELKKLVLSLD